MTFYNVISGILFMGAFQAFVGARGTPAMSMSAILMVILCNEAILTSELLERDKDKVLYSLSMKFIDLLTFFVLAYALMVLSPDQNTFGVGLRDDLWGADRPGVFLGLLTVYWALTYWWNQRAGQNSPTVWSQWFIYCRWGLVLAFLVATVVYWPARSFADLAPWPPLLFVGLTVAYMLAKLHPATRGTAAPGV